MGAIIFNEKTVGVTLILFAVATPFIALAWGGWAKRRSGGKPELSLDRARRVFLGIAGPAALAGWWIQGGVIAVFGLDSLPGLAILLAIFTAAGVGAGLAWRRMVGA